jgi:hypothetical protein
MISPTVPRRLNATEGRVNRRKIANEAEARACIAAHAGSGLSSAEWARAQGIDGRSLRAWTNNLQREAQPKRPIRARSSPLRLVELVPSAPSAARYVVRVGAHAVEVDAHFDEPTLRRLLSVLSTC